MKSAFAPHEFGQFRTLHDWVVVQDMNFKTRTTSSGIILHSDNGTGLGIRPRWGRVYAIGPEQKDVTVGQWICVAHGRWTRGVNVMIDGQETSIRKVDPKDILLISDEEPQDDTMSTAVHVPKPDRG
jgi:co-chaperonin GroES (HSP10)|nr:hypothetical protein [Oxalobacteraceae bacterium]